FDTLWRHLEPTLRIELVKARKPMHARRIQGTPEVKQHCINTDEVHAQSLSSTGPIQQRWVLRQCSTTRCLSRCDWCRERRPWLHARWCGERRLWLHARA